MTKTRSPGADPAVLPVAPRLLRPDDLAVYLAVPLATIYRWRSRRDGPASYRVGRHVRYKLEDVEAWLEGRRAEPALPGS